MGLLRFVKALEGIESYTIFKAFENEIGLFVTENQAATINLRAKKLVKLFLVV